jgi:hypothetical protein
LGAVSHSLCVDTPSRRRELASCHQNALGSAGTVPIGTSLPNFLLRKFAAASATRANSSRALPGNSLLPHGRSRRNFHASAAGQNRTALLLLFSPHGHCRPAPHSHLLDYIESSLRPIGHPGACIRFTCRSRGTQSAASPGRETLVVTL